jgi:lipopolysaccharide transport system ATP-binding protein
VSETVIHVDGLGKRYRVGERERYLALRDVLTRAFTAPFRRGEDRRTRDYLWALRDVSFDVQQGEVVGLIGRNGAGKTTLLKILSRITRPTAGSAEIHGRVASLLEVGTGFHPELTGRENVFLSGAILGMKKGEIVRKFHEIVDFAGVERYIDTPLKHFSTGMQMRLAFAVAAHLEPEILFVDEVLAVGDLEFQKKCLGKMQEVSKSGRTIVFVSHQMNQIRRLCERVLWIDAGQIRRQGPTAEITATYEAASSGRLESQDRPDVPNAKARFQGWEILEPRGERPNVFDSFGPLVVRFTVLVKQPLRNVHHGIVLYNSDRQLLWGTGFDGLQLEVGVQRFVYKLPTLPLRPGAYNWRVTLHGEPGLIDDWDCVPELVVATKPVTHRMDEWAGFLNIPCGFSKTWEELPDPSAGRSGDQVGHSSFEAGKLDQKSVSKVQIPTDEHDLT